jgi:Flp pilus assembly protein TadG
MKRIAVSTFWHRFRADRRGTVAIIVGLTIIGLVGTAGLGVDFFNALAAKSRLDLASDAAAIAAINAAQTYITTNSGPPSNQTDPALTSNAIVAGKAQALKVFKSNAGSTASIASTPTVTMTRTGQIINATVSYTAASQNAFGPMFGVSQINMNGNAASSLTMGKYLDFYLLLDVSGSMGIPSTNSEQTRLAAINPDYRNLYPGGCTIACHFKGPPAPGYKACQNNTGVIPPANEPFVTCQGYNLTRISGNPNALCSQPGTAACIQLRLDAVAYATQQLLATAQAEETIINQYRVGLYPFIRHMQQFQTLSANLATTVTTQAGLLTTLIDNGDPSGLGSGGTHFENALPELNTAITTVGNGSGAATPQPFVFLVTDGAQNNQIQTGGGAWSGSNHATTLNTADCSTLKNRGITLSILYVPYVPIQNPTTIWTNEDGFANANIPNIPPSLKACASPGFFYTANTPQDINNAMQDMFHQVVALARLTQ